MDEVAEALEKYQGLVPLVYDVETMGLAEARPQDMQYAVYLKREADKVIAELKAENERLRGESCKLTDGCLRLKQCRKEKAHLADELRHSNHKRCLAMAWWCERKRIDAATFRIPREKWDFYDKWYNRWLALAEEPTWAKFLQLIHKEDK